MITLFALASFGIFAARRLLTYLHLFQQEEYDGGRFLRWLAQSRGWDRRLSLSLLVIGAVQVLAPGRVVPGWAFTVLAAIACLAIAAIERDPRKTAKKPLAMTTRTIRIYAVALALAAGVAVAAMLASEDVLWWVLAAQLVPIALVAANLLLAPAEALVQRGYWQDARARLQQLNPIVIAVTGSYGKTSVKHILGHILETAGPTLITPGSVNTAMGIARVVRERLQPHHRYFVVEMGAYGIGSIKRLCALTPPRVGIITAIGKAHYERFKSLDAVARAKFELAEAVSDNHGRLVVAADILEFAWPREFVERHRDMVVTVGEGTADFAIGSLRQERDGIVAEMLWGGTRYELRAPLFGLHQGHNVALAFAAACSLGLAPEDVVASLRSTPQIAHRLEVKRQEGDGAIVIDDAYNSNPVGFASALGLLDCLRRPEGRRILVTPGMAELGSEHEPEHARIGRLAAEHADVLVAVAPHRVAPLVAAFTKAAPRREVVSCATFAEAQSWLDRNLAAHDVVLIENDLPDILERKLVL